MPKKLTKAQRAFMLNIINDINDEAYAYATYGEFLDTVRQLPEWREWMLQWPLWCAGENMPGYTPDNPYTLFLTERAARGLCLALRRQPGGEHYVTDMIPITLLGIW